jgi:hypothetical protein
MEPLLDNYYLKQPEPMQSCLLALKDIILGLDKNITHQRRFQIPFFYYKDKKLSYLWVTKKKLQMGFIEDKNIHPKKEGVKLKDKYESMIINPQADIPIELIIQKLNERIALYKNS